MTTQKYIDDNKTTTFKKGDKVVMFDCYEAFMKENKKTWVCMTYSFKDRAGQDVVFLEDYSGYFMSDYLRLI